MYDIATYFAWFVIALLLLVLVVIIVWLGSLPGKIASKRNHPQVDAINACSWIGLAMLGAGWPIAFVWAFLRSGPMGADAPENGPEPTDRLRPSVAEVNDLKDRIIALEHQLDQKQS